MYDYIIIGGGISGLYLNYLLAKNNKTLLLEKNDHIGGRIYNEKFYDTEINTGARVGGLHNKYLMKLIKKFKMKYKKYDEKINTISKDNINLRKVVKNIIKKYNSIHQYETKEMTAKQFIIKYFGKKLFEEYQRYIEYTDFFENSIETYIKLYPIVDHIPYVSQKNLIKIDWNLLTFKISEYIKKYNEIKTNYNVRKIVYQINHYIINNEFKAKRIILCVTINPLKLLIKKSNLNIIDYSKYIDSVDFLRIFTYHQRWS
jgi:protoporphyrinogen oxidase